MSGLDLLVCFNMPVAERARLRTLSPTNEALVFTCYDVGKDRYYHHWFWDDQCRGVLKSTAESGGDFDTRAAGER